MIAVRRKTLYFITKALLLIFACRLAALSDPGRASPIAIAETLLVKQEYATVERLLTGHCRQSPDDIDALYLRVAAAQTELLDYESYTIGGDAFMQLADSVRQALSTRLAGLKGIDSVKCLFYIANIYGGIGVVQGKQGNWFSALRNAVTSITMLKEVVKHAPDMNAARLGIGIFHYYLSRSFKWLPFINENSALEGLREIERATDAPFPFNYAAKNSLCWILIDHGHYQRADSLAATVLAAAPGNTIFLCIRCLSALWGGRHEEAIPLAKELARISLNRTPVNWSDYVTAYYALASAHDAAGRRKEALEAADFILKTKIPDDWRKIAPVKKNLKRIREVRGK